MPGSRNPILTFAFIKADLGVSHTTFYRIFRRQLPVVRISDRKLGVLRSSYERWKSSRLHSGQAA